MLDKIVAWDGNAPLPFNALQKRIGRKTVPKKLLRLILLAYDLLEDDGDTCARIRRSGARGFDALRRMGGAAAPLAAAGLRRRAALRATRPLPASAGPRG